MMNIVNGMEINGLMDDSKILIHVQETATIQTAYKLCPILYYMICIMYLIRGYHIVRCNDCDLATNI